MLIITTLFATVDAIGGANVVDDRLIIQGAAAMLQTFGEALDSLSA